MQICRTEKNQVLQMMNNWLSLLRTMIIEQLSGIYLSDLMILLAVLALLVLVPGYIICIKKGISYRWAVHLYMTLAYLGIILIVTVFRRELGSRSGNVHLNIDLGFSNGVIWSKRQIMYCLLNVILFIPWGFCVFRFMEKENVIKGIVLSFLVGFSTSVFIEITQLITRTGVFEITDILTNTSGTCLGALLCAILMWIFRERSECK